MSRGITIPLSRGKNNNFPRLLGLATQRIPSSKGEQVHTPINTNLHTHSALMAPVEVETLGPRHWKKGFHPHFPGPLALGLQPSPSILFHPGAPWPLVTGPG